MSQMNFRICVLAVCMGVMPMPSGAGEPLGGTPGTGLSGTVPPLTVTVPARMSDSVILPDPRTDPEAFVQVLGGRLKNIGILDENLTYDMKIGQSRAVKALVNDLRATLEASNQRLAEARIAAETRRKLGMPAPRAMPAQTPSTGPWEPTTAAAAAPSISSPSSAAPAPQVSGKKAPPKKKPVGLSAEERRKIILETKPTLSGGAGGLGGIDIDRVFIDISRPSR